MIQKKRVMLNVNCRAIQQFVIPKLVILNDDVKLC